MTRPVAKTATSMGIEEPMIRTGTQRLEWSGEKKYEGASMKVPIPKRTRVERRRKPTKTVMVVPERYMLILDGYLRAEEVLESVVHGGWGDSRVLAAAAALLASRLKMCWRGCCRSHCGRTASREMAWRVERAWIGKCGLQRARCRRVVNRDMSLLWKLR